MLARMIAVGGGTLALVLLVGSDPADAQNKVKAKATAKATTKATAKAKAKFEPLNTDTLFKKLDLNKDALLDLGEFSKILTVEPAPRRKKDAEPLELPFVFKSLDANSDKMLDIEEFRGVIGAIYPNGKK
ncbi:EF-hand domain-containing protein [bacterium]|nr:EF-hand domain-containing protein [bacterium]